MARMIPKLSCNFVNARIEAFSDLLTVLSSCEIVETLGRGEYDPQSWSAQAYPAHLSMRNLA